MLKKGLQGRTLALVGYQTLTSRIILKKILHCDPARIIAIEIGKQGARRQKFLADPYFSEQERVRLQSRVSYVPLGELPAFMSNSGVGEIDILLSLFQPVDFEVREKVVEYHLLTTSRIASVLSKVKIGRCILLSSIYLREGGYVGEEDEFDEAMIPLGFTSREQALGYFKDNFQSEVEGWRWSIGYIERSYYSFCKSIVVVRVPSLGPTLCSHEGYALNFNYLTYLMYQMGVGSIQSIYGAKANKVDMIPNDYLSNLILVLLGRPSSLRAQTINLSTSTRNYITLQQFVEMGRQAWEQLGYRPGRLRIVQSKLGQRLRLRLGAEKVPSEIKKRLGGLLDVVSWKIEGQRASLQADHKVSLMNKYKYFLNQEWLCECIKTIDLNNQLSASEQAEFCFNVNGISWRIYIRLCVYAIRKHLLHERVQQFKPEVVDLLGGKKESYFSDVMWALRSGKSNAGLSQRDAVQFVLNSKAVKEAIRGLVEESMVKLDNAPTSYERAEEELRKVAEEMCVQMFSDYSMGSIRFFGWFLHKLFRAMYERVVVDKTAIAKIQAHDESLGPLIVIPTHRSYVDFLIINYIFFGYGIKCPHIAAAEDFLNMAVVHILLRRSGAFFIKRNQRKHRELYRAIMSEYLSKLLTNHHYVQFFIEGTRSRTGKMLPPKFGILSVLVAGVAEGKVRDAFVLPVTINYERVLEGNSFTYEMMGEAKVKESLSRVLKSVDVLKENYGRIYIEFCDMISVRAWLGPVGLGAAGLKEKVEGLGERIVREMGRKLVIAGPAIVSSVVLMNRKGISDDSLQEQSSWLAKEVSSRGVKITRSQADSSISVSSSLELLEGVLSKSQKDMFQVRVSFDQNSFVQLFTLTYYRNTLTHIFFEEAVVATSLASFGYKPITAGTITRDQLFGQCQFVWGLLQGEFYLQHKLSCRQRFDWIVDFMAGKGVVGVSGGGLTALNLGGNYFNFYWSLVWPVVESYWITCLYLFKLLNNKSSLGMAKLLTEIQWFGQKMINQHLCDYLEAISSDTIRNAVAVFKGMKVLLGVGVEVNGEQMSAVKIAVEEPALRKLLERIQVYRKRSYAKSLKGIVESGTGSVNLDFPFLSRL